MVPEPRLCFELHRSLLAYEPIDSVFRSCLLLWCLDSRFCSELHGLLPAFESMYSVLRSCFFFGAWALSFASSFMDFRLHSSRAIRCFIGFVCISSNPFDEMSRVCNSYHTTEISRHPMGLTPLAWMAWPIWPGLLGLACLAWPAWSAWPACRPA